LDHVYPSFENELLQFVVPPSEIMQIRISYSQDAALIAFNLTQVAKKYSKNRNETMFLKSVE
jgi:hypothetical protein